MRTRLPFAALIGLIAAAPAAAHFAFLVPAGPTAGKAVFSDSLKPDDKGVPVERIGTTKLTLCTAGKCSDLAWTHDKAANCYTFEVPGTGPRLVFGTTDYGIFQRGDTPPAWLKYHSKAIFGDLAGPETCTVGDQVPLELIPIVAEGKLRFKAIAAGKPLAKTDVTVLIPGEPKGKVFPTDADGLTGPLDKPGQYGAYVRLVETKPGEQGGKKYEEIRHYATLVVSFEGK